MSTLTITISRDGADLVLSGSNDSNEIGITNYTEPAKVPRVRYAPTSTLFDGDEALGKTLAQTLLSFDIVTDKAATEAESQGYLDDVFEAINQFSYTVTVVVNDAPPRTWQCDSGALTPAGSRTLNDLESHNPVWTVQIPCKPQPTVGA